MIWGREEESKKESERHTTCYSTHSGSHWLILIFLYASWLQPQHIRTILLSTELPGQGCPLGTFKIFFLFFCCQSLSVFFSVSIQFWVYKTFWSVHCWFSPNLGNFFLNTVFDSFWLLIFWDSNYIYVRPLGIVPHLTEALLICFNHFSLFFILDKYYWSLNITDVFQIEWSFISSLSPPPEHFHLIRPVIFFFHFRYFTFIIEFHLVISL